MNVPVRKVHPQTPKKHLEKGGGGRGGTYSQHSIPNAYHLLDTDYSQVGGVRGCWISEVQDAQTSHYPNQ